MPYVRDIDYFALLMHNSRQGRDNPADILDTYPASERSRVAAVLDDLLPYLSDGQYSFVGKTAIGAGLLARGLEPPSRDFNDLDLIATGPGALDPQLRRKFLIHHYHGSSRTEFRVVMVHLDTLTKVDVFHWWPAGVVPVRIPYGDRRVAVQPLETQLAVTVFELLTMWCFNRVDPKQLRDAEDMLRVADPEQADAAWRLVDPASSLGLAEAFAQAKKIYAERPELLGHKPWNGTPYACWRCVATDGWPVASMQRIYELLGYVELMPRVQTRTHKLFRRQQRA